MDELYQKQILELARQARNKADIAHPTHHAKVNNPTCGDSVSIAAVLSGDEISQLQIDVEGCALCEAGAGLLVQLATHASASEVSAWHKKLDDFLQNDASENVPTELVPLTPIKAVKNRHKCVKLSFVAFESLA